MTSERGHPINDRVQSTEVEPRVYVWDPRLNPATVPGFSVTAPWAFIWFLDGNENKLDISIVGTYGKIFLINAHGVLRRMGAATEIPGSNHPAGTEERL